MPRTDKHGSPVPALMLAVFLAVGIALWCTLGKVFYLLNFAYIGAALFTGLTLYGHRVPHARLVVQFLVGTYMLVGLGIIGHENMQIEGFWYYLFLGVFEGAVIHYLVAKLAGPFVFGRGWCGYACWTAMVLDLLPFKHPQGPRRRFGVIRYLALTASLLFAGALLVLKVPDADAVMSAAFIVGNIVYYAVGIALAFALRDNRAFCKYICPVAVLMKPASRFALVRVRVDEEACDHCGACVRVCPMDVDVMDPSRNRTNATECILCMQCVDVCPKGALR